MQWSWITLLKLFLLKSLSRRLDREIFIKIYLFFLIKLLKAAVQCDRLVSFCTVVFSVVPFRNKHFCLYHMFWNYIHSISYVLGFNNILLWTFLRELSVGLKSLKYQMTYATENLHNSWFHTINVVFQFLLLLSFLK